MTSRRQFLSLTVPGALAAASPTQRRRSPMGAPPSCSSASGSSIAFPSPNAMDLAIQQYIPNAPPNLAVIIGMASRILGNRISCIGSPIDQKGSPLPFTSDTPFEIASITKTFVATVYELFVKSSRLNKKTLGEIFASQLPQQIGNIPLLNLASYTSGLPADDEDTPGTGTVPNPFPPSYDHNYTKEYIFEFLANATFPITAPGPYTYSNLGFSLLAFALEAEARGTTFGELIANELLIPLGMTNTQPWVSGLDAQLPVGYTSTGGDGSPGWPYFPGYYGAGGLVSTPNDLMTWLQFNMGIIRHDRLSSVLPVVQAQGTTERALGWFITTLLNDQGQKLTLVQKNGDLSGFSSQMAFLPRIGCAASEAGIFVLVNQNAPSSSAQTYAAAIAYDLMFTMSGLKPPSNLSRSLSS
jgi:D-alanyl-D-alanine-carboxypeptidase/D-alanyl-D-alanine-endopeptidase